MNKVFKTAVSLALLSLSASSFAQSYAGYPDIPAKGIAFATGVVSYEPGAGVASPQNDTSRALGEPDLKTTSLGRGGNLVLSTGAMKLTGDGTDAADFYVYEHKEVEAWDTYVSVDNATWVKIVPTSSVKNSTGTVNGYNVDALGSDGTQYQYIKFVDTSNSAGASSAGADIDGVVLTSAKYSGGGLIVDTDSRNGEVFNLEKNQETGAVEVKKIKKDGSVDYIIFSQDDSLDPVALSVQGNFDCDDEKDINVLATRKDTGIQVNIIKDQAGNDIRTIDNSVVH
jgi:hypothetical protein